MTDTVDQLQREIAGAIVDLKLRTSIELEQRLIRWTASPNQIPNPDGRVAPPWSAADGRPSAERIFYEMGVLVREYNRGTLVGVEAILDRWATQGLAGAHLEAERQKAHGEALEIAQQAGFTAPEIEFLFGPEEKPK